MKIVLFSIVIGLQDEDQDQFWRVVVGRQNHCGRMSVLLYSVVPSLTIEQDQDV